MSKRVRKLLRLFITFSLFLGLLFGMFYLGVIFDKGNSQGFSKLIKEQGINVFFGVIGGFITSGLMWYTKLGIDNFRLTSKHDKILSGIWDEYYEPTEFTEIKQEQALTFKLEHKGEKITGILTGNDSPNCPPDQRHGSRLFLVHGHVEGKLTSISAVLDSDESIGHTVYLLEVNHDCTILNGITIYYDQNESQLTTAKTKLVKRKRNSHNG